MPAIIVLAVVVALAVIGAVVFLAVVVAIHSEPRQMATEARGPVGALVRRLLGVHVSKPADSVAEGNREECLTGQPGNGWHNGGWGQ